MILTMKKENTMKKLTAMIVAMAMAFAVFGADAPYLIPFQGRLTDQKGVAYTEGQYTLIFNLYDTAVGGTSLWTERHEKVGVINGMVNLFLGSITSLDEQDFSKTRYLGITVDADGNANSYDPEMIPRQMIIPAFHAQNANKLQGMDWSAVLSGDITVPLASRYINPDRIHDGTISYGKLDQSVADKLVHVGMVQMFAGSTNAIPIGWLLCDGRILKRSAYPRLFDVIGTSWNYTNKISSATYRACIDRQSLSDSRHSGNEPDVVWDYYLSGSIFGAEPGEGRCVLANYWRNKISGESGRGEITMTYTYNIEGCMEGTYHILFTKVAASQSCYSLYLTYDGAEHKIEVPSDSLLSSTEWTYGPEIQVTNSLEQIKAVFNDNYAGIAIPALQIVKVIPPADDGEFASDDEFRLPDASTWALCPTNQPPADCVNFIIKY